MIALTPSPAVAPHAPVRRPVRPVGSPFADRATSLVMLLAGVALFVIAFT
jgi:hypothetical protein